VEEDAPDVLLFRVAELLADVPRDGLALAIRVGGQEDVLLVLRRLLDLREDGRLALDDVVLGFEVVLDVDAELRLREVHDVADRRLHLVVAAQVLGQRLRLGGRLDDDEMLRHQASPPAAWPSKAYPPTATARSNRMPG